LDDFEFNGLLGGVKAAGVAFAATGAAGAAAFARRSTPVHSRNRAPTASRFAPSGKLLRLLPFAHHPLQSFKLMTFFMIQKAFFR
jgi:hypothetical protein